MYTHKLKSLIRLVLTLALLFDCVLHLSAQTYQKTDYGVKTTVEAVDIEIQVYSPSIIRVIKSPHDKKFRKETLSVIKNPEKTDFRSKPEGDQLHIQTKKVLINLNLKTGVVAFYDAKGNILLTEKLNGVAFKPFNDSGDSTYSVSQSFVLDKDESIYGLGQLQNGKMVQRNQQVKMIQGNTKDYIPFMHSAKGYGLFWDNYSPTTFSDNQEETSFVSEVGDCVDYYFMFGGNADGVIANMRDLTGQVPMFPLWTFGFWQSKERYKSQDELVNVVRKYRDLGVPLDGVIQDWQYWGNNYLWNAMEFLNPEFYDPKKMVDDVHHMNAHMIISIWSSFGPQTKPYRELEKIGALYNIKTWPESGSEKWPPIMDYPSGVRVYDAYNPEAREIYWKYLNKGLFSLGIDGWWMDSTEPDHFRPEPADFDTKTFFGSFRKVRNAYPLVTVGGVAQHQRSVTNDKRVFILTRSAFAGQQRYAVNIWSGDVVASWETLKNQISSGLNFSLCGIPYWNSDIGGFFLWNYKLKLEDAEYRELYARWLQFGAFTPLMRSHGEGAPREIYQFGKKGDKVYDAIEKYINLRYSLLPYLYSSSWSITANQSSMMRALMMDFPKDPKALDINDQYLFGKSLLVCPVTSSMYSKDTKEDFTSIKSKEVYLPQGSDWVDFWTSEKHNGGKKLIKETPIDIIPLYVKTGSVLPVGPKVQYATEKKWDNLEIRIYPGANGEFVLYEDENDNYNYEKGAFSTITFMWDDSKKTLTISDREGSFPGMLNERRFNFIQVAPGKGYGTSLAEKYDKEVIYNGVKTVIKF